MTEKKKINKDNQLTKKETMTLSTFDPIHDDWEEFAKLVRQYADGMSMDSQKRNFLLSKVSNEIRNTLANHGSFDDCITSLSHQFGDKIRVTTDRIAEFVSWTQKPVSSIDNLDAIGNEVTEMKGFVGRLVNPRGITCKCDVNDAAKFPCTEHKGKDHCKRHCEFESYKEDSDRLHSVVTTLSQRRLPFEILQSVGLAVRNKQKSTNRLVDVKEYIELVSEHVNNHKNARTPIGHSTYASYGSAHTNQTKDGIRRGRENQLTSINNSNDKTCLFCGKHDHWISSCIPCKNTDYKDVLTQIKARNGCAVCLRRGHLAANCKSASTQNCVYCESKSLPSKGHRVEVCWKKPKKEKVNVALDEMEDQKYERPPDEFYSS